LDLNIKMPEIIKKSDSAEDLGSEGHGSPRSSTNPSPSPTLDLALDTKHPLQNQWTLWYYKIDRSKSWEDNQREVTTFSTVEDFWALYNHIEFASKLQPGCDYSLFKTGVRPMWEDQKNYEGGRWLITIDKRLRSSCLDSFWLEIMMCLIGEAFGEFGNAVNGAVVNVRMKGDKIAVWLAESQIKQTVMSIGQTIKTRLGWDSALVFEVHRDSMNKNSSAIRAKYTV